MKFLVVIALIMLLSFAGCLYFPWWSIAIAAFIVSACIPQKPLLSFVSGFAALLVLWGLLCIWISSGNQHILAHRVSLLLFKKDSPFLLIFITALIGALVAGFASLTASFIRRPGTKGYTS